MVGEQEDTGLNETGYAYACWDDKNNIWIFGETTGLSLPKYDGNKNWEFAEITDERVPYPIEKVMEIKGAK